MFKPAEKSEINQVSLTGMRSIILLGLLTKAPRSLKEIRDVFISLNIMEQEHSDDIIRIDLNTLRSLGCKISMATKKTQYKYVLEKSIFSLVISNDEIDVLKKVYKKIKSNNDIETLVKYHELFIELANFVEDENIKEEIYGISVLKSFDLGLIKELYQDCNLKRTLKIIYATSGVSKPVEKEVYAEQLKFKNDKIYLYGYDLNKKRSVTYNIQRIKAVLARFVSQDNIDIQRTNVKFCLKNFGVLKLEENEKIIETTDSGYIVEGIYYNDFVAIQRILSFGSNCTVIEPLDFRNKIIEKLKSMSEVYND